MDPFPTPPPTARNNDEAFRTCKFCGKKNLAWRRIGTTWRLIDGEDVHECGVGAAIANMKRAFEKFISGKRNTGSTGGQIVGHETYRLLFSGLHESMVWEAIEDLEREIQDANKN